MAHRTFAIAVVGIVMILWVSACGDDPQPNSTPVTLTQPVPTVAPVATTPPTDTPSPSATAAPTFTPAPTAAPAPTTNTPIPPPGSVQNLEVVKVTEDSITLQWKPPANSNVVPVERYEVTRDISFGRDEHDFVAVTTFTDVGLRSGAKHKYRVRAIGAGGVEGVEVSIEVSTSGSPTPEPSSTPTLVPTAVPVATPVPTPDPTPTLEPTSTSVSAATPVPTPEPTPTLEPTSTSVSAATPVPTPEPTPTLEPTSTPVPTATLVPTPEPPTIEELGEAIIIGIKGYPEVRDAAISQDGRTLSLVLIVAQATSQSRAQQLGDNFVRMTKTLLQDGEVPGQQIGRGEYDYLIGVYRPNEEEIALGAKSRTADRISW